MLKIKEILIKIILFKINHINLVNFQKIIEGINFNINHKCYSKRKTLSGLCTGITQVYEKCYQDQSWSHGSFKSSKR
jgi:hypothetical protein